MTESTSVAEIAEKPLYRVTCGDIGTNPEAVEKVCHRCLIFIIYMTVIGKLHR